MMLDLKRAPFRLAEDQDNSHSSQRDGELTDDLEDKVTTQPAQGVEQESSEDEMVFEAYVSPSEVSVDQEDADFDEETLKVWISGQSVCTCRLCLTSPPKSKSF